MDDCRRTLDRLTPYVDDALPPPERADVDHHLGACPECRDVAAAEQAGRTILRAKAPALKSEPLPPGLRSRCEALAREHTARPPRAWWAWRPRLIPVSLSAVVVVVAGLAVFSVLTRSFSTVLAAQLTMDHAKCFRLFAGDSASGVDAKGLERMLQEHYGWTVRIPPSSPAEGIQLVGARRCLYAEGVIPHVMYRVNGRDVSLYVLDAGSRRTDEVTSLGHRSHIWSRDDTTYVLVWPVEGGDMTNAVRYVMRELQ